MAGVKDRIGQDDLVFDSAVVAHGFAPHLRDYEITVEVPAAKPDGSGESYIEGRYVYRFTHCVEAHCTTAVSDETWSLSWRDEFTDYARWKEAGAPEGYVWGTCFSDAYPGLSYVDGSTSAADWSRRLTQEMHEVALETNAFTLRLVFHDFVVEQVAVGDATSGELRPIA
jgi:hypothetical protein